MSESVTYFGNTSESGGHRTDCRTKVCWATNNSFETSKERRTCTNNNCSLWAFCVMESGTKRVYGITLMHKLKQFMTRFLSCLFEDLLLSARAISGTR